MQRWGLILGFLGLCFGAFTGAAALAQEEFQEGVHYERVNPPQPVSTGDKIEVLEVFWYGCPHCYRFEPFVERWLARKPANAEFVRLPGVLNPNWEPAARAFYTAELLGVFDKIHMPLFNAIHQQQRPLDTEAQLMEFFAEHGVSKDDFKKTYNSFAVETKVRRAQAMQARYGIDGVPAVIVNGKYRVSARTAGGNPQMLKVIDYLVAKEGKK
jgi:thiol:disulfide interchange protein DsbA